MGLGPTTCKRQVQGWGGGGGEGQSAFSLSSSPVFPSVRQQSLGPGFPGTDALLAPLEPGYPVQLCLDQLYNPGQGT